MTTDLATPERSYAQRRASLNRANEIRSYRAGAKRKLKRKPPIVASAVAAKIISDPPDRMHTMKVVDLLLSCPKFGPIKAHKTLRRKQISPSKTLAGLSERQRRELTAELRA